MAEQKTTIAIPVFKNTFLIKVGEEFVPIAGQTSLSVSFSKNIESYADLASEGWTRKGIVGGELVISSDVKRIAGDPGNDEVYNTLLVIDTVGTTKECKINFSDGSSIEGNFVVAVNDFLGESQSLENMSVEFHLDGKPTFTPATGA